MNDENVNVSLVQSCARIGFSLLEKKNKKQCSRQLQCEVPCASNVVNSSLFVSCCRGGAQGTFHPPCHIPHYHMVLRPEGTSHNEVLCVASSLPPPPPNTQRQILGCVRELRTALLKRKESCQKTKPGVLTTKRTDPNFAGAAISFQPVHFVCFARSLQHT